LETRIPRANFFFNRSVLSIARHVDSKELNEADSGLTQEKDKVHVLQQLVRAYLREELDRVLDPICQRVLFQILKEGQSGERSSTGETEPTDLVVSADWSDVNDGIGVVKERRPAVPLSTRPADVVQPPLDRAIIVLYDECVLRNANGLDPCMKDVVDGRHVTAFGDPIDLIKETEGLESVSRNESSPFPRDRR
jgi:hypothetical protein